MFPECRLLHDELKSFNWIVVNETSLIIIQKVAWIGQKIETYCAGCPWVDAHHVECILQPFEYTEGRDDVADVCYHRVPETLIDSRWAQVVPNTTRY